MPNADFTPMTAESPSASEDESHGTEFVARFWIADGLLTGVLAMCGSSLLVVRKVPGGLTLKCPACRARGAISPTPGRSAGVTRGVFLHKRKSCPVLVRTNDAIERYSQITSAAFN